MKSFRTLVLSLRLTSDFTVYMVCRVPADEAVVNVTFAIADELANQGFTAITIQGRHIFIYLYS